MCFLFQKPSKHKNLNDLECLFKDDWTTKLTTYQVLYDTKIIYVDIWDLKFSLNLSFVIVTGVSVDVLPRIGLSWFAWIK